MSFHELYTILYDNIIRCHIDIRGLIATMATTYGGRTRPISITLPNAMVGEIDRACEAGHYTRSEYIREILRFHLFVQNTPAMKATA